jgi:hypothetical protein
MRRSPYAVLCRSFFARLFASESATSDEDVRDAIIGVLAFILTPCLLILIEVFPQFQLLVIRVGRLQPPPGVVVRATAVRNINGEDMLEWTVAILVGYSMVTMGLIAVWVWDGLSFDRRDAMVLGPLPLRWPTIVGARLTALAAFLWAFAFAPAAAARRAIGDGLAMLELAAALMGVALVLEWVGRVRASRWSIDDGDEPNDGPTPAVLNIGFVLPGVSRI